MIKYESTIIFLTELPPLQISLRGDEIVLFKGGLYITP